MQKYPLPCFIGLFFHISFHAQSVHGLLTSDNIRLLAYSTHYPDAFSFSANQGALARLKNFTGGIGSGQKYLLKELTIVKAAVALPVSFGAFGFATGYYGFSNYSESSVGIAYGLALGSKVDVGVQFNYHSVKARGYGSASAICAETGLIAHLTDKLNGGVHIYNPAGGTFKKYPGEKLPFIYSSGLGYEVSESFFVGFEIEKEENVPVNVNAGFQYGLLSRLFLRAGLSTATSHMWMGAGISIKSFRVDIDVRYHPVLGISPGLILLFEACPHPSEKNNDD